MQASEITHYLIHVSEDVAPLNALSTHLKTASYDLIPEVRNACYDANVIYITQMRSINT